MSLDLTAALDLVVIVLLAATIGYGWVFNRRLGKLRDGRAELELLVKDFGAAATRAEASVAALRKTAAESGEGLQRVIDKAVALREELNFMIESGNSLAARIEGSAGTARAKAPTLAEKMSTGPSGTKPGAEPRRAAPGAEARGSAAPGRSEPAPRSTAKVAEPRTQAERDLLDAIENLR